MINKYLSPEPVAFDAGDLAKIPYSSIKIIIGTVEIPAEVISDGIDKFVLLKISQFPNQTLQELVSTPSGELIQGEGTFTIIVRERYLTVEGLSVLRESGDAEYTLPI